MNPTQTKTPRKRYDLPLQRGSGGQLVAWTVGVMSYLTVLMLVLVFALNTAQQYWQNGLTGRMTVEIPYHKNQEDAALAAEKLVAKLNTLPGITAHFLNLEAMGQLVGPWLGTGATLAEMPLPALIDVTRTSDDTAASIETLKTTVQKTIPEASLDTHEEWLADLMRLAKACRMILIVISVILGLTAALTVAATSRTRLALHKEEVDLLHLIGATDAYIATQFQRQAFRLATEGAAGGLAMALITLGIIALIQHRLGDNLLPSIHLTVAEWVTLILTPLIAGVIAMAASRVTVLKALKQLP